MLKILFNVMRLTMKDTTIDSVALKFPTNLLKPSPSKYKTLCLLNN